MKLSISLGLLLALAGITSAPPLPAQEQVDKADAKKIGAAAIAKLTFRVRAVKVGGDATAVQIVWRRGGEGLGGLVIRGEFLAEDKKAEMPVGTWSAWTPVETVTGRVRGWEFVTVVVSAPATKAGKKVKAGGAVKDVVVEFEFAESGRPFKTFAEPAPDGGTVGFAFPGGRLSAKGAADPVFVEELAGLSAYAKARRQRVEKFAAALGEGKATPEKFAVIGHLGGYGPGAGYGVRHNNPEIVKDECRVQQLLGMNGFVGGKSVQLADTAGVGKDFRRIYWGGPGSGTPMAMLAKGKASEADGCPFDPALPPLMIERVKAAIAEHKAIGAKESWALWDDEIGVYTKEHMVGCARCRVAYCEYLKANKVTPADVGKADWDAVVPYPIWPKPDGESVKADPAKAEPAKPEPKTEKVKAKAQPKAKAKAKKELADPPNTAGDGLNFYYTYRFMTHATAQVYPPAAKAFAEAGIKLYAMQGPTPSWAGASLDWHEFYDHGANTAFVFETSNRDARVWQLESYLADLGRGICVRHGMPMGVLVKPHRGAPLQRMLSVAARGAGAIEWYTYGPDYSKGDSFSQRPDLLEAVARGGRFLADAEPHLYGAAPAGKAQVAFCFPRSSEIWDRTTGAGVRSLEDAKWVYIALRHAHLPVDIVSERQLAEGIGPQYKALYVVGSNLRRDAAGKVAEWVKAGGTLWTDAGGIMRDEANLPLTGHAAFALADKPPVAPGMELFGPSDRKIESWGQTPRYGATTLAPFVETGAPKEAGFELYSAPKQGKVAFAAVVGREVVVTRSAHATAEFADQKPAMLERACGKGRVMWAAFFAGLTYSAKVRRADFDMTADFSAPVRSAIAAAAERAGVKPPVFVYDAPLVEPMLLEKDGKQCVALMNWAYRNDGTGRAHVPIEGLTINLDGAKPFKSVRSLRYGQLIVIGGGGSVIARLPKLEEIDLLVLE